VGFGEVCWWCFEVDGSSTVRLTADGATDAGLSGGRAECSLPTAHEAAPPDVGPLPAASDPCSRRAACAPLLVPLAATNLKFKVCWLASLQLALPLPRNSVRRTCKRSEYPNIAAKQAHYHHALRITAVICTLLTRFQRMDIATTDPDSVPTTNLETTEPLRDPSPTPTNSSASLSWRSILSRPLLVLFWLLRSSPTPTTQGPAPFRADCFHDIVRARLYWELSCLSGLGACLLKACFGMCGLISKHTDVQRSPLPALPFVDALPSFRWLRPSTAPIPLSQVEPLPSDSVPGFGDI
jgi:hypothetical protein